MYQLAEQIGKIHVGDLAGTRWSQKNFLQIALGMTLHGYDLTNIHLIQLFLSPLQCSPQKLCQRFVLEHNPIRILPKYPQNDLTLSHRIYV